MEALFKVTVEKKRSVHTSCVAFLCFLVQQTAKMDGKHEMTMNQVYTLFKWQRERQEWQFRSKTTCTVSLTTVT